MLQQRQTYGLVTSGVALLMIIDWNHEEPGEHLKYVVFSPKPAKCWPPFSKNSCTLNLRNCVAILTILQIATRPIKQGGLDCLFIKLNAEQLTYDAEDMDDNQSGDYHPQGGNKCCSATSNAHSTFVTALTSCFVTHLAAVGKLSRLALALQLRYSMLRWAIYIAIPFMYSSLLVTATSPSCIQACQVPTLSLEV